jgi:hypothetical protein
VSVNQKSAHGVIEGGQIRLLQPITIAEGTVVELIITIPAASEQARMRQLQLLRKGVHLGGPPYARREELYER